MINMEPPSLTWPFQVFSLKDPKSFKKSVKKSKPGTFSDLSVETSQRIQKDQKLRPNSWPFQAFWHTRQRFAASLACSSAACYLLGIGDRCLGAIAIFHHFSTCKAGHHFGMMGLLFFASLRCLKHIQVYVSRLPVRCNCWDVIACHYHTGWFIL